MFRKMKGVLKKFTILRRFVLLVLCGCFTVAAAFSLAACNQEAGLAKYKTAAMSGLETYVVAKGEGNYSAEKWAGILAFVTDGKAAINTAADKPGVDAAVATAKAGIDGVLTVAQEDAIALAEYKAAAKAGLETYAAERREYYTLENWTTVEGLVAEGKTTIDAATDKPGVDAAIATAKGAIKGEMEIVEVDTEDMVDYLSFPRWPPSNAPGGVVVLNCSDENAVFECEVTKGAFALAGNPTQYAQKVLVAPGNSFRWESNGIPSGMVEPAFIDIVLKIGDNFIGHAVFEILGSTSSFTGRLLKSVLFPEIVGEYQNVTEEYVKSAIEKVKNTHFVELDGAHYVLANTEVSLTRYIGTEIDFTIPQTLMINGINRKVTSIGCGAFSNCTTIKSITLSDNVKIIDTSAFSGCTALESFVIPDSITFIGNYAFSDCTTLENITIPNSVTQVYSDVFDGWASVQTVYIQTHLSKPATWNDNWYRGSNAQVVWGVE